MSELVYGFLVSLLTCAVLFAPILIGHQIIICRQRRELAARAGRLIADIEREIARAKRPSASEASS